MAKLKAHGCSAELEISSVFTAIAGIMNITIAGAANKTKVIECLDGGAYEEVLVTGQTSAPTLTATIYYDPGLAAHQAITDCLDAPAQQNMKVKYSDSGPSTQSFATAGLGFDVDIQAGDFVQGTLTAPINGDPGWTT